jgi:lanosterol synthase
VQSQPRWCPQIWVSVNHWAQAHTALLCITRPRFTGPITPIVEELREELIFEPYKTVDWAAARSRVASEDLYTPHTLPLEISYSVFNAYERVAPTWIRNKALDWIYELIQKEDEFTK